MGNPKHRRRLGHATGISNRYQKVQIAQINTPAEAARPLHGLNPGITGVP
jgi:hypothetical protein